ncbi:flagellin [Niallia endozanthoxylica]|uniref:Flagellin n=1 Tax=Niallia endozanthoxylica TaxID=2036016 RepID=A0A5J5HM65_9BACI|nr:flagellin [Niallia endozanthoxylica]
MDGQEGVIEQSFKVTGNRDLSNGLMIEEGMNDSLSFLVDDVHKTIQLSEGTYTSEELIDEINHRLTEKNAGVSASYSDNRLVFRHHTAGENHKISQFSGNAFTSLFFSSEKGKDAVLTEPNQVQFQIGANSGNSISLHFMNTETTAIGVDSLSVIDAPNRKGALSKIDKAIEMISSERSTIGVIQNRLEYTINNLSTYSENLTAAESRIRDLDMAREIMAQTKNSILTQASQAMLAQSNQIPQGVLQLLR